MFQSILRPRKPVYSPQARNSVNILGWDRPISRLGRISSHKKKKWPPCALCCIFMCTLLFYWIPRPRKPGYSHQNHNSMSFVGWDMVKIGVDGGHFEKCPLQNSAHTFARGIPAKFFIQPSKKANQQKNRLLLSTVTELLEMTQLIGQWDGFSLVF